MDKTEDEILALLANQQPLSIAQIAKSLNLTKADIRYQTNKLIKAGKVNTVYPVHGEPGRPAIRYQVADNYFSDNYSFLLEAFIKTYLLLEENETQIVDQISSSFSMNPSQPFITRINDLVSNLNCLNYQARWEARYHGPIIIFLNCPYRQLAKKYPEFCRMDQKIVEQNINKKVKKISTIVEDKTNKCAFQVLINDYQ